MLVSLVIPTYNERGNIVPLVQNITKILERRFIDFEVVVVDGDSPDGTFNYVRNFFTYDSRIRIFSQEEGLGLAASILFGIKKARGTIIIGMDADFNHPPSLIPKLIDKLSLADLVVASRFIKGGTMQESLRYHLTYTFNLFIKHFFGFPISDNLSGYYAIKRKDITKLPLEKIYRGYGEYHLRLLKSTQNHNLKIAEVPVKYGKRRYGHSKSKLTHLFFRYLWVAFQLKNNETI